MKKRIIFIALVTLVLLTGMPVNEQSVNAQDGGYVVVVNSANPASSVNTSQLSRMFLKKEKSWDHGASVEPVDLVDSSAVRDAFTEAVHGKSLGAIKSYWQKQIFSGRGTPPSEMGTDAEVIAFVQSNPGGVGYVSPGADVSGVKVITVN